MPTPDLFTRLCRLAEEAGWSQARLASELRVKRQAVTDWKESRPDIATLLGVARLFRLPPNEFKTLLELGKYRDHQKAVVYDMYEEWINCPPYEEGPKIRKAWWDSTHGAPRRAIESMDKVISSLDTFIGDPKNSEHEKQASELRVQALRTRIRAAQESLPLPVLELQTASDRASLETAVEHLRSINSSLAVPYEHDALVCQVEVAYMSATAAFRTSRVQAARMANDALHLAESCREELNRKYRRGEWLRLHRAILLLSIMANKPNIEGLISKARTQGQRDINLQFAAGDASFVLEGAARAYLLLGESRQAFAAIQSTKTFIRQQRNLPTYATSPLVSLYFAEFLLAMDHWDDLCGQRNEPEMIRRVQVALAVAENHGHNSKVASGRQIIAQRFPRTHRLYRLAS